MRAFMAGVRDGKCFAHMGNSTKSKRERKHAPKVQWSTEWKAGLMLGGSKRKRELAWRAKTPIMVRLGREKG